MLLEQHCAADALRGTVFVDPTAVTPYVLHVARVSVVRGRETIASDLVAVKQTAVDTLEPWPPGFLSLLIPSQGTFEQVHGSGNAAQPLVESARIYLRDEMTRARLDALATALRAELPERERTINAGFAYQESELAEARQRWKAKVESGTPQANEELAAIKHRQHDLARRREAAIARVRDEPDELSAGDLNVEIADPVVRAELADDFVAHAYVVPTSDPELKERFDADVEATAVRVVTEFEERFGAQVLDVSRPDRARAAGLEEYPGFDLLSRHSDGSQRAIEVKGRATTGAVQMTLNELVKAASLGDEAWLYVVYGCAGIAPELQRVRNPANVLRHRISGHAIIERGAVVSSSTLEN